MNAIIQILILCLPWIIEGSIEAWFEKKRNLSVNHFWSAVGRGVLMFLIAGLFNKYGINTWWQSLIFEVILFGAFFNFFYNALTGRKMFYLRAHGFDKLIAPVPPFGRAFCLVILVVSAAMLYFHLPVILGKEFPDWLYVNH